MNNLIEKSYKTFRIDGCTDQKTFYFKIGQVDIKPGQFYMLNYNNSQKPFSVSHYDGENIGFTILKRGNTTLNMIENAIIGDYFGLTGPLGNSFQTEQYSNFLLIGGGVGAAPIYFLSEYLSKNNKKNSVLFGSRTSSLCDFTHNLKSNKSATVSYYTDDNSGENQGFVTNGIEEILQKEEIDTVCLCGPEKMMIVASEKIKKITSVPIQISMERYMKCGIGICGSCVLDDIGLRVCADGPVFDYELLITSKEFGKYHRNSGGLIEKF